MSSVSGAAAPEMTEINVLHFSRGLPGLDGCRNFYLELLPGNELFMLLRAAEEENVALILVDPFPFFPGYRVELTEGDREELKIGSNKTGVLTYTTVAVSDKKLFTNLAAPLVINAAERTGKQLILPEAIDKLRVPLIVR